MGDATCGVDGAGPALTTGEIQPGGWAEMERERRMWTVRETVAARPGATLSWTSEPSARDVEYRVELDARPALGDGATVSRSWDIGTGESRNWSDTEVFRHARQISPDGDVHEAEVEITESDDAVDRLGTDLMMDVRLIADGEIVAACGSSVSYGG